MISFINIQHGLAWLAALLLLSACSLNQTEEVVPPPTSEDAAFTFSYDAENANLVTFSAQQDIGAWYTHWSFGDNSSAEGLEAERLYPLAGEYEVRFKVFTEGGTAESVQTIVIENDIIGPNLVQNGEFEGDEFWTVLPISPGVEVAFENGTAAWSGGGWGQVGIYQSFNVEANTTYQIDMDVVGNGLSDCWFEVYVGTTAPTAGVDYTDGGIRLGLNTWDGCGGEPLEGPLSALSCSVGGGDGTFQFPTRETVYLVIRGGGAEYGSNGIVIDNVSVREI